MICVLENLLEIVLLLGLFYVTGAVAAVALIEAGPAGRCSGPWGHLTRFVLGVAAWIGIVFFLCAVGWFRPTVLWSLIAASGIASLVVWRRKRTGLPRLPRWRKPEIVFERSLLSGALNLTMIALFLLALLPVIAWDSNTYHLTVPKLYAAHGGFREIPFNVYSNWPLNTELLFGMAMQLKDFVLAKLVHWSFGVGVAAVLYFFGRDERGGFTGLLAAVLFVANPVVLFEGCIAYVDIAFAFFWLTAFWYARRAFDDGLYVPDVSGNPGAVHADPNLESPDRRALGAVGLGPRVTAKHETAAVADGHPARSNELWRQRETRTCLLLAGICSGILAGTKLTAVAAVLCLALLLLWMRQRDSARRISLGRLGLFFGLPVVVLAAPWYLKSWYYTGDPIYPFAYGVFGGKYWSASLTEQWSAWQQSIGMGRSAVDYLLLPVRVVLQGEMGYGRFDGSINRLWLLWGPVALVGAWRSKTARFAVLLSLGYFVFWAASSQQVRYLIPVLPFLSLAAALGVASLTSLLNGVRARRIASGVVAMAVVGSLIACSAEGLRASIRLAQATAAGTAGTSGAGDSAMPATEPSGSSPCQEARGEKDLLDQTPISVAAARLRVDPHGETGIDAASNAYAFVFDYINAELPPDVLIMFLNTNHGFYCDRPFIADSFFEASQMADVLKPARTPEDVARILRSLGVTHVLWRDTDYGIAYPAALFELLNDPHESRLLHRSPDGPDRLYEIRAGAESPASLSR